MGLTPPTEQLIVFAAGDRYRFLATANDTDGAYALWHAVVPPGGGPSLHKHAREDERFDVLAGSVRFHLDGAVIDAQPGDAVFAPRNSVHAFRNLTDSPAEMLIHVAPGGMEQMFLRTGTPAPSPDAPIPSLHPDEIERIKAAAPDFGIEILGPPID